MSEFGPTQGDEVQLVDIEEEIKQSYLDYAMSVIVGRALPDARDGLKPVHKRVLFAMNELNNVHNRPYVKSARVVGEVIGKYHPHGDGAAYETIVRMAQDFNMRYTLVDGQGNFGSIDPDPPAAQRYTEVRMTKIASELLADLDKDTVDFVNNYDDTLTMPSVLPTRVPNLLVNGSSGIAVGFASNIPPHNISEVLDACIHFLNNPDSGVDELIGFIQGPDFPTGGIINGRSGILQGYKTGRGKIYVRGRATVEADKSDKERIIITEIPYQLRKNALLEKIAELFKDKKIEGITELRDESDKDGLRIVIELRRGESGEVVLNNLYSQTQLQSVFSINNIALVDGQPKLLNLKEMIAAFIDHRKEVVTRRTLYLLRRARQRAHILEGQAVALANIDEVIELIKSSPSAKEAREGLVSRRWIAEDLQKLLEEVGLDASRPDGLSEEFGFQENEYQLTEEQAQAILEMRLHRLTSMEQDKLVEDYRAIVDEIKDLMDILSSAERLRSVVSEELLEVKTEYGDGRRTEIVESQLDLSDEDLIAEEDLVLTISHLGYAKTQPLDSYQAQRRGGRGKAAAAVKDQDFVEHLLFANSHATVLCFSNKGKVYWLKVYQIPQASRSAKGRPMVNILPLDTEERITTVLPITDYGADHYVFMATANGTVKKTPLEQFSRPRSSGLIALDLEEDNHLVGAAITDGDSDILLCSSSGKAVRFKESAVRSMGRGAKGVRGIRLSGTYEVISLIVPQAGGRLLTASENGYGKCTEVSEFPTKGRGGQGIIAMQTSDRNGDLVGAVQVFGSDEVMLISNIGTLVRIAVDEISVLGRNTQGVKLISLKGEESLNSVERVFEEESEGVES